MKVSCLLDVMKAQQDLPDVFRIVDVLMGFLDVFGVKDSVDNGFKMTGLYPFYDAIQLLVHDRFIGPGAHVDAKHGPVSVHQSERVKFRRFPQGEERLENRAFPSRSGCRQSVRVEPPTLSETGEASSKVISADGVEDVVNPCSIGF